MNGYGYQLATLAGTKLPPRGGRGTSIRRFPLYSLIKPQQGSLLREVLVFDGHPIEIRVERFPEAGGVRCPLPGRGARGHKEKRVVGASEQGELRRPHHVVV